MSSQTGMRETRAPSRHSKSFQPRIKPLVFVNDKWDRCMHGQGIVSGGALTPSLGFRSLKNFADPNFEYRGCHVVCGFAPIITNKRVGRLLVQ